MAIKSAITTTVNGFITAIITQAKLRSGLSTLLDNFYPTPVNDSFATETYTTKGSNANVIYSIRLSKVGRQVNIIGTISNTGSSVINPGYVVFTWKSNEFYPETTNVYPNVYSTGALSFKMLLNQSGITVGFSGLPAGMTVNFNTTYNSLD